MSKVQCWDVVEDLINEASKRVKPLYAVNEEKMEYVKNVCKTVIQDAADSNDAEAYEVEVDKITMEIRVSVKFENYPTRIAILKAIDNGKSIKTIIASVDKLNGKVVLLPVKVPNKN